MLSLCFGKYSNESLDTGATGGNTGNKHFQKINKLIDVCNYRNRTVHLATTVVPTNVVHALVILVTMDETVSVEVQTWTLEVMMHLVNG